MSPTVVDVETARRAVAQVARERDALAQQLQRSQSMVDSLRRQLEARTAEATELLRTVRALQARVPPAAGELEEERERAEEAHQRLLRLGERLERVETQLATCTQERDVAVAERDQARASLAAARAEAKELGAGSPDAGRAQRLAADLANVKRRQEEAIERGVREQTDHLLVELVSVRDSVLRALDTLPGAASAWHDGLLAVLARVDGVLEREGVHLVGHPGERFDPRVHEAVGTVEGPGGVVVQTVSSGLVREDGSTVVPAKVLVGGQT
ncbi:MAG TPA: nucleotide exchange factor GrpE [Deltaproteobacteria bacterium]|nr:nucleotide exchange factor GrpE [Deltaproteobacteria bacterium]